MRWARRRGVGAGGRPARGPARQDRRARVRQRAHAPRLPARRQLLPRELHPRAVSSRTSIARSSSAWRRCCRRASIRATWRRGFAPTRRAAGWAARASSRRPRHRLAQRRSRRRRLQGHRLRADDAGGGAQGGAEQAAREGGRHQDLGGRPQRPRAAADAPRIAAIIDEAHKRGLKVNAHVFYLADLKGLVDAGIDGLAHLARDLELDDEAVAAIVKRGVVVMPTLATPDRPRTPACRRRWPRGSTARRARAGPGVLDRVKAGFGRGRPRPRRPPRALQDPAAQRRQAGQGQREADARQRHRHPGPAVRRHRSLASWRCWSRPASRRCRRSWPPPARRPDTWA